MTLTDSEKLALLERYFTERPSPLFGERLRLMELAFAENPIWMKRKLNETRADPQELINVRATIRRKQSPKHPGSTTVPVAFSPATLSGLAGWWKADAIVGLVDGNPISTWVDSSGNGRAVTQGTAAQKPLYKTGIINGKPVVRFDGIDDWLTYIGPLTLTDLTVFCVASRSSALAFAMMVVPSRAQCELRWDGAGTKPQFIRQTSSATWGSIVSGWHIYQGDWLDATDALSIRVDGGIAVTVTEPFTTGASALDLGARNGVNPFAGDMAEIVIYNRTLSDSERHQVESYLMSEYAII